MRPFQFRPWRSRYGPGPESSEQLQLRAADGVRLSLRRLRPPGGDGPAVILCHGLSSNHHGLDFPGRSLAAWLSARGYDCYVPDLRGNGESERPHLRWDLDDHLLLDVPAILGAVREASGRPDVHWIGHSMGGVLLFCHGILEPGTSIRSALTVGSALDYRVGTSGFQGLLKLRAVIERLHAIPYGTLVHLLSPLLGRRLGPIEAFQFHGDSIEPELARRLFATAFHTIPVSLLASLGTTFEEGGLRNRDGSVRYLERAPDFRLPLRLLAGSADQQVSATAVEATAELLRGEVVVHGTRRGDGSEYGHWDLLLGRRAEAEVWPGILEWLRRHEAP